jgi:hypothetical protein
MGFSGSSVKVDVCCGGIWNSLACTDVVNVKRVSTATTRVIDNR